ncbi:MBL fold metallo-hydrolase [Methanococcus aeolicus]|uniref:Beta-lactamase domain protein n=1 Tax=Methanococcus aeolicus (strain ATCC BAA-1280 / DSM 17508 / OCM 812 / Nankai-3) TaxID=419665 RepID=A6UUR9_META3|nr:MBL fold metallo-hydrolase [Methanococcus aeolicus]ABR56241.1 beta-lactamase domain protein [Methanococcus aeolicus Nankai-3]UXM84253.1 MBL fold metallo-hydrolase [Methanococcus aeolicus]
MIYKLNGIGHDSNSYLIVGKKNILIDPGTPGTFDLIRGEIEQITKNIDYIVNTHCHYDHAGANYLYEEYFNAPVIISDKELKDLKNDTPTTVSKLFRSKLIPPKEIIPINDAKITEELKFCGIEYIETPGHTEGGITIIYKNSMITGDTLFAYGVGRWDFPTGNIIDLRNSIAKLEVIANQKNIIEILPGHGEKGDLSAFNNAKLFL